MKSSDLQSENNLCVSGGMLNLRSLAFSWKSRGRARSERCTGRCFPGQDVVAQWPPLSCSGQRDCACLAATQLASWTRRSYHLVDRSVQNKYVSCASSPCPSAELQKLWNRSDPQTLPLDMTAPTECLCSLQSDWKSQVPPAEMNSSSEKWRVPHWIKA